MFLSAGIEVVDNAEVVISKSPALRHGILAAFKSQARVRSEAATQQFDKSLDALENLTKLHSDFEKGRELKIDDVIARLGELEAIAKRLNPKSEQED